MLDLIAKYPVAAAVIAYVLVVSLISVIITVFDKKITLNYALSPFLF